MDNKKHNDNYKDIHNGNDSSINNRNTYLLKRITDPLPWWWVEKYVLIYKGKCRTSKRHTSSLDRSHRGVAASVPEAAVRPLWRYKGPGRLLRRYGEMWPPTHFTLTLFYGKCGMYLTCYREMEWCQLVLYGGKGRGGLVAGMGGVICREWKFGLSTCRLWWMDIKGLFRSCEDYPIGDSRCINWH